MSLQSDEVSSEECQRVLGDIFREFFDHEDLLSAWSTAPRRPRREACSSTCAFHGRDHTGTLVRRPAARFVNPNNAVLAATLFNALRGHRHFLGL